MAENSNNNNFKKTKQNKTGREEKKSHAISQVLKTFKKPNKPESHLKHWFLSG